MLEDEGGRHEFDIRDAHPRRYALVTRYNADSLVIPETRVNFHSIYRYKQHEELIRESNVNLILDRRLWISRPYFEFDSNNINKIIFFYYSFTSVISKLSRKLIADIILFTKQGDFWDLFTGIAFSSKEPIYRPPRAEMTDWHNGQLHLVRPSRCKRKLALISSEAKLQRRRHSGSHPTPRWSHFAPSDPRNKRWIFHGSVPPEWICIFRAYPPTTK